MSIQAEAAVHSRTGQTIVVDAVVIGAGFAGLGMLYELRQRGLSAAVIEAASGVGGTWYWNRYPGARTDSESWVYAYSFSKELCDEWQWQERFPTQPEALSYLRHVADRFDLLRDITFSTRVESARYEADSQTWLVSTDRGSTYRCRYLITAVGLLSLPYQPPFAGLDGFQGKWYLTGDWPHDEVDFTGKKVAVIGTGATGVQAIPIIAHTAEQVIVFQRTPNYVLPARNYTLTDDERKAIRINYDAIWEKARNHFFGFPLEPAGRTIDDATPEEQQRILDRGWEDGGMKFFFEAFDDIMVDPRSNKIAAEFVRNKIRTIVKDPHTAELLCPSYPIGAKRLPLGHFYYEAFNRDNVALVDVSADAIAGVTSNAIQTQTATYPVDIIVFATGFDAVTGQLTRMDIRGVDGVSLKDKWAEGPRSHLGISVDGFPNMYMLSGPHTPFANIPVVIEAVVEWIGHAIEHIRTVGAVALEATPQAVEQWRRNVATLVEATVLADGPNSWFLGRNIPGKPNVPLFYFGGVGAYRREIQAAADNGYDGFTLLRN
jgi:cation diffusion facilitator CzcD-associated flavoprotein CzcO